MNKKNKALDKIPPVNLIYQNIKTVLEKARITAYRSVNFAMVQSYWEIGRIIVEEEQKGKERAKYGKALIKELSIRLTGDYGKGFNERNLWYMRDFYLIEVINNRWSTRELERQINSLLYERLALSKDKNNVKELSIILNEVP